MPSVYGQRVRARNLRHDGLSAQDEVALGSCPIGSWVELYDLSDQLIYRGYVEDQRTTWGYTVVMPVTEGDGNFIGRAETWAVDKVRWEGNRKVVERISDGTLQRIYSMSEHHNVASDCPVKWLGEDEELKATLTIEQAGVGISQESEASSGRPSGKPISLLPVVSLWPEEVGNEHDASNRDGEIGGPVDPSMAG